MCESFTCMASNFFAEHLVQFFLSTGSQESLVYLLLSLLGDLKIEWWVRQKTNLSWQKCQKLYILTIVVRNYSICICRELCCFVFDHLSLTACLACRIIIKYYYYVSLKKHNYTYLINISQMDYVGIRWHTGIWVREGEIYLSTASSSALPP